VGSNTSFGNTKQSSALCALPQEIQLSHSKGNKTFDYVGSTLWFEVVKCVLSPECSGVTFA